MTTDSSTTGTDATSTDDRQRRRRKVAIVLVAGSAALVLGGGVATAYWTTTATGSGSAQAETASPLTISAGASTPDLHPGGTGALRFSVTNPNSYPVTFTGLDAAQLPGPVGGCSVEKAALAVTLPAKSNTVLAAGATQAFTYAGAVSMGNLLTNQDACQGVAFTFAVTSTQE